MLSSQRRVSSTTPTPTASPSALPPCQAPLGACRQAQLRHPLAQLRLDRAHTTTTAMAEVQELVDFLVVPRPEVQKMAADIVQGLTGSADGIDKLKGALDKQLLTNLFRLVPAGDADLSRAALVSLVNLSQDPAVAAKLLGLRVVARTMEYLREKTCPHTRLLLMLLANITVTEQGSEELLQLGQESMEGLHMAVLLKWFVVSAMSLTGSEGEEDTYEHIALVLTNVTRRRKGRELLLQPGRGLLQALVAQLKGGSGVRKQGSAGAIRNCCLAAEEDGTLEQVLADEEVLKRMMKPINGLEPLEKDDTVREALAESIQVLAATEAGRKALQDIGGPDIIHKGYEYEETPSVCSALEHAYASLVFTGAAEDEEEGEAGSERQIEAEVYGPGSMRMIGGGPAASTVGPKQQEQEQEGQQQEGQQQQQGQQGQDQQQASEAQVAHQVQQLQIR